MKLMQKLIVSALAFAAPALAFAFPIAMGGEGLSVLVATTGNIVATYQGNSADYKNQLYLVTDDGVSGNDVFIFDNKTNVVGDTVNLGSFSVGTELVFRLLVTNTGNSFYTGDAARNTDNHTHARVQEEWFPGTTLVSFEDLFAGPFDFNDLSYSFTNTGTTVPDGSVPEPASLVLLGLGLSGLVAARRRKVRKAI